MFNLAQICVYLVGNFTRIPKIIIWALYDPYFLSYGQKTFRPPPWPFSQRRPCRAWKYWDLNFDDWKCLGRPFFISMAFFNSQRSLVLEIIGGGPNAPPPGVMSNSEHPAWTGLNNNLALSQNRINRPPPLTFGLENFLSVFSGQKYFFVCLNTS